MSKFLFKLNKKLGQGLATLKKVEKRELEELITAEKTPNFVFMHFGLGTETDFATVKEFIVGLGIDEKQFTIDIYPGYAHGFLAFADIEKAEVFLKYLKERNQQEFAQPDSNFKNFQRLENLESNKGYFDRTVMLSFEDRERNVFFFSTLLKSSDMVCGGGKTNSLPSALKNIDHLKGYGLSIIRDVVSEIEEAAMLDHIHAGDWENLSHRRVQHYGYKFIYGANSINPDNKQGELPTWTKIPLKNMESLQLPDFDQCTVNDYKPGDGIPPHTDSHAPFEEPLVSVSLLSDIVMTFKNPETKEEVSILLPRRSAVLMEGEIRYLWTHAIATRKVDRVENDLLFRRRRISLTYRKSRNVPFCECKYPKYCDYAKKQAKSVELEGLGADFEKKYVKEVYNAIAEHFSHTRYKPWPRVKAFLDGIPKHSLVGDIGCGNGKYLFCTDNLVMIGTDIAESFASICREKEKGTQTLVNDTISVPFKSNSLDYAISIAVIHHLSTVERRSKAISELIRIIRPGGRCLIYVWAYEQEKKFGGKDVFVPWNNQIKFEPQTAKATDKEFDDSKNTVVYKRYYHMFEEGELEALVCDTAKLYGHEIGIIDSYFDHENWCINLVKK